MKNFLTGLGSYLDASGTGFRGFIGSFVVGNSTFRGPFRGDSVPEDTVMPYMTFKTLGDPTPIWGFDQTYMAEEISVRFTLYDADPDNLDTNIDLFVHTLDLIRNTGISCSPDSCKSVLRTAGPTQLADQFDEKNRRVYSYTVTYLFRVSRAP